MSNPVRHSSRVSYAIAGTALAAACLGAAAYAQQSRAAAPEPRYALALQ